MNSIKLFGKNHKVGFPKNCPNTIKNLYNHNDYNNLQIDAYAIVPYKTGIFSVTLDIVSSNTLNSFISISKYSTVKICVTRINDNELNAYIHSGPEYEQDYVQSVILDVIKYIDNTEDLSSVSNINIIFITRCANVLSDIFACNTIYLDEHNDRIIDNIKETFAGNIYDIMSNIPGLQTAVSNISQNFLQYVFKNKDNKLAEYIGDPMLKRMAMRLK